MDAFSSIRYVGTQTVAPPTNFRELRATIIQELENTAVRSPRSSQLVFATLKVIYRHPLSSLQISLGELSKAIHFERALGEFCYSNITRGR